MTELGITTPLFRVELVLGRKLRFYQLWIGCFFINLIYSDNNTRICLTRKSNCLNRLRLHAVIGCDDNHNDICQDRTVLAQCRKRLVTWCIE